jgi:hypothetical protein
VCWDAENLYGEIGDGNFNQPYDPYSPDPAISYASPTDVLGLDDALAISPGNWSTCALRTGGKASCWGDNRDGQLGDGSFERRLSPVSVSGIGRAKAIETGGDHSCAILSSGRVKCWGDNSFGQLGTGTREFSARPVLVKKVKRAVSLSLDFGISCATQISGRGWCWGNQTGSETGDLSDDVLTPKVLRDGAGNLSVRPRRITVAAGDTKLYKAEITNTGVFSVDRFRICLKLPRGVVGSRCRPTYDLRPGRTKSRRFRIHFTREVEPGTQLRLGFQVKGTRIESGTAWARAKVG